MLLPLPQQPLTAYISLRRIHESLPIHNGVLICPLLSRLSFIFNDKKASSVGYLTSSCLLIYLIFNWVVYLIFLVFWKDKNAQGHNNDMNVYI